MSKIEVMSENA